MEKLETPIENRRLGVSPSHESQGGPQSVASQAKNHLFINYASEDGQFAEWLTLRLTAEGYKVWCDRTKLLGGESYPTNIDEAIKTSTFRFIALLSKHSVHKANPLKERTLALNISKERTIDFLIPLNLDGLRATELDWMTNDLTFIPFHEGWATGLVRLLKKLRQINAPRFPAGARQIVSDWVSSENDLVLKTEVVWSNVFPITELPERIIRFHVNNQERLDDNASKWPFFQPLTRERTPSHEVWAFNSPVGPGNNFVNQRESLNWKDYDRWERIKPFDVFVYLLRRSIEVHCIQKGMNVSSTGDIYFPDGLLYNNRLKFTRYDGKHTNVNAVGERTFRLSKDLTEKRLYHLSPRFRPLMGRFGAPTLQINLGLVWTDKSGVEDPAGKSNRRRKKVTRTWWNYEWLSRITATAFWMTDGKDTSTIIETDHGNLTLSLMPLRSECPVGIDEKRLGPREEPDDEHKILDDIDDEEEENLAEARR